MPASRIICCGVPCCWSRCSTVRASCRWTSCSGAATAQIAKALAASESTRPAAICDLAARVSRSRFACLFGEGDLAADVFAGAFRDVLPFGRIIVDLGPLRGTSMLRSAAVVLAGLGDAVAFFLSRFRGDGASERCGADAE